MHILMLAQFYHPIIGGEEQHVRTLSVALAARGHAVAVATLWHAGLPEFELDEGVRVFRLRGAAQRFAGLFSETERRHVPPLPDPELVWGLRRVLAQEQPDIVHAHNWFAHSFLPLKTWSKAKLVMTLHDYSFICAQKRLIHRGKVCAGPGTVKCFGCAAHQYGLLKGIPIVLGNRAMSRVERSRVDRFIAVSQAAALGNGWVASALPFQVIPNFVHDDFGEHGDSDFRLDVLPAKDYLLFVGDVTRDKGIQVLFHAYESIPNAPPLVVIGRHGVDAPGEFPRNVVSLGSLPHDAVIEATRRCIMALVPSLVQETFGFVALEAMAMSKPVIASRIGGLVDIVLHGETGYLVPPGDSEALRDAIVHLLEHQELRQRMGQAARHRADEFRASVIVPRFENVYEQALRNGTSLRVERSAGGSKPRNSGNSGHDSK